MNALFDSAALAIVAYAEVTGSTGASTLTNSGVTTTRSALGVYSVTLQSNQNQVQGRDLIFVQVLGTATAGISAHVDDTQAGVKVVRLTNSTTLVYCDFMIMILRTVVPPPAGAPA